MIEMERFCHKMRYRMLIVALLNWWLLRLIKSNMHIVDFH